MRTGKTRSYSLGGGLLNLAELGLSSSKGAEVLVVGDKGEKIEILESVPKLLNHLAHGRLILSDRPQRFLNEEIIASESGRFWLSSRLAIARKLLYLKKLTFQRPHIWLATGIFKVTDAKILSLTSQTATESVQVSVPMPDPTTVSQLLQLQPGLKIKLTDEVILQASSRNVGEKVYAAQFQRLDVDYFGSSDIPETLPNQVNLLNVFSIGAHRGESDACTLSVTGETAPVEPEKVSEEDAEVSESTYWTIFEEEVKKCEEEWQEEIDETD